jgi:hypothetical protein
MKYGLLKTAYASEMRKLAAPRQIKELRKLLREGKVDEANELAQQLQAAGVLKNSEEGTFLVNPGEVGKGRRKGRGRIAGGAEGIADLVIGAKDAPDQVAIRKTYDRQGKLYVPGQEDRKVRVGEALEGDSAFGKIYTKGEARKNRGGYGYMLKEYVQGQDLDNAQTYNPKWTRNDSFLADNFAREAQERANRELVNNGIGGYNLRDVYLHRYGVAHPGNMMITPSGNMKVVDFIVDDQERFNRLAAEGKMYGTGGYYPNASESDDIFKLMDSDKRRVRESFGDGKPGSRQKKKVRGGKVRQETFVDKLRKQRAQGGLRPILGESARSRARRSVAADAARIADNLGTIEYSSSAPRTIPASIPAASSRTLSPISKKLLIGGALGLGGIGAGLAYKRYKDQQAAK